MSRRGAGGAETVKLSAQQQWVPVITPSFRPTEYRTGGTPDADRSQPGPTVHNKCALQRGR